jgi:hypothetical protein
MTLPKRPIAGRFSFCGAGRASRLSRVIESGHDFAAAL